MKTILLFLCLLLVAVVQAAKPGDCTFESIMALCGNIPLATIDDAVYGKLRLRDFKVNVVDKVADFSQRLQSREPGVEGVENPDVAISYAFMHYVCFDPLIAPGQEKKVYDCMADICPRVENIEAWCEGMNM